MGRHVVGALGVVGEDAIAVRYQPREEALEIALHRGVGVLLHHQARRGVPHEQGAKPLVELARGHRRRYFLGEIQESAATGAKLEMDDPGCHA